MATNSPDLPDLSTLTTSQTATQTSAATTATNTQAPNTEQTRTATSAGTSTGTGTSAATSTLPNNLPGLGTSSSSTGTSSASVITDAPSLTSGALSLPSNLPTLSNYYSYPPPSVPPTADAPYMQATVLPQNFVFIVVGACLAFIALIIILWRFIAAWSINRNFRRDNSTAAYAPLSDTKKRPVEPSHNMADLSSKLPKSFNSVPNLFFSPTAEVARQSMVRPSSQHMPAGHYRDGSR